MKHRVYITGLAAVFGFGTLMADVTGVVRGSDSQPIQGASVVLLALPDSTFVDGALTDAQGHFSISGEQASQPCLLSAQAFGHERKYVQLTGTPAGPLDITLALAATELGEVTVRGKAPSTTREGGKFIFIPNDLADDVSSANNLMKHVPLVSWGDGRASITGKGISKVYLNGRDPHWDTNEIQAMLRTLDPHCIKRVEVITDPGATQAASYGGGVINIIYDDPSQGWRGNVYTSASLNADNPSVSPMIWMNYQRGKFKSSANVMYYYGHDLTKETRRYDFAQQGHTVVNELDNSSYCHSLLGKLNLSYDLTPSSILGAGVQLGGTYSHASNHVMTTTTEKGVDTTSEMRQTQETPMKSPSFLGLLYYTLYTDRKGSMLDVLAGYGAGKTENNYLNNFSGQQSVQDMSADRYAFSGKAAYTQVFDPRTRLQAGVEFVDCHDRQDQSLDGDFRSFKYYDRQIHGYVQFIRTWSDIFSSEIGLRLENTHTYGHQMVEDLRNTQDYTDLFPSVNLSWNIPAGSQSVALSYRREIRRPNMMQLDPYKIWSSDNSYSQGNPDLRPSYTDHVSLYYSFLRDFIFNTLYGYDYRLMTPYTMDTPEGYSMTSTTNSGRSHYLSMSLTYNKGVLPWWRISAYGAACFRNIRTRALEQGIHASGWEWGFSWDNTFIISRRHFFTGKLAQDVQSASDRGTYREGCKYRIMLSLQKAFPCGLDISAYGMIPVVGFKNYERLNTPDYSYEYHRDINQYSVGLSLSYSFGKSRVEGAKDRTYEVK